jgi:hypothetical protein
MLEALLPEHARQLLENYQNVFSQLASQLRWLYFDDSSRLVTRVGYLDDGYIRLRLDGHWEFTGELLRELSWTFYNISEVSRNVDVLKNALASVGTDKVRATIVDALPLSPFNLTQIGGTSLTGRDWSGDFAKLQNLDTALSSRASESTLSGLSAKFPSAVALGDSLSNPTATIIGNALLGFDGTYWRRVRVDTSGRLAIQNEPNLDVALSTRASETTLSGIKSQTDKLTFDSSNYLQVNVKATVNPSNLDVALSTRASEATLSSFVGTPDSSPPSKGVALLGFDGTYARRVRVTSDGKLLAVLG